MGAFVEFKYLCAQIANEDQNAQISPSLQRLANAALYELRKAYILSEFSDWMGPLDRLERSLNPRENDPLMPAFVIAQEVKHLIAGTRDLLEQSFYFHVDGQDVPLYINQSLFGDSVSSKFDLANEDIDEAGKCLALQRSTACVFHLMRVVELGVQKFGRKLKISLDPKQETWHQIMIHVNNKIASLPSKTAKDKKIKSRYAEAAVHLQSVRLAWRNEVMHPKQTYTRQEAHEVFYATRVFMASLAEIL